MRYREDGLPLLDEEDVLKRDNIIYVRDRVGSGYEKALAWIAGIGSILIASSILFVARSLFDLNERLARIEEKVSAIDRQVNPQSLYRGRNDAN